ncbi:MAG: alpha/beta hydrolase [Chitinophagales bacterium]
MKFPISKRYLLLFLVIVLALIALLGPKPKYPPIDSQINPLSISLTEIDTYIQKKEATFPLKENNQARIVWADSIPQKTPYSIVFVHGFSASPMAGNPIIQETADHYGCNVYFSRLADHGIANIESFKTVSPKDLIESVKEAIAVGNQIGEKTIIMASSTGATLSAYLAASNPEKIEALLFYAPLIALEDPIGKLLSYPWGLQIARQTMGSNYRKIQTDLPNMVKYWTMQYRLEGLIAVQNLLDETMITSVFEKIKQPLLVAYYHKDEANRDQIISIEAAKYFYNTVSTPKEQKTLVELQNAGTHVLLSDVQSKDLDEVRQVTFDFLDGLLK